MSTQIETNVTYIKYQSNYYLREESKINCQEETTQNKANKLLASLQNTIKVDDKQKRWSRGETLYLLSYFVIKIAQDSQINMSLNTVK